MSVQSDTRSLRRWLEVASVPTAVLVACREHEDLDAWLVPRADARHVVYRLDGCLADLPPAGLLEILAGGAASVAGLLDGCANPTAAHEVVASAHRIAAVIAGDRPILALTDAPEAQPGPRDLPDHGLPSCPSLSRPEPTEVLDARAMPVSRRTLIGAGRSLDPPDAHPAARLHNVVRELLGDDPIPRGLDEIPTGAAWLAAPGCGGAGVCVRTCPTNALALAVVDLTGGGLPASVGDPAVQRREPAVVGAATFSNAGTQQFALSVDPTRCIDCGQCVDVCPESAMERVGPLPWAEALEGGQRTLRVGLVQRCTRCGTPSRSAGPLCDVCSFRSANPFGSLLPPGFSRRPRT